MSTSGSSSLPGPARNRLARFLRAVEGGRAED